MPASIELTTFTHLSNGYEICLNNQTIQFSYIGYAPQLWAVVDI